MYRACLYGSIRLLLLLLLLFIVSIIINNNNNNGNYNLIIIFNKLITFLLHSLNKGQENL